MIKESQVSNFVCLIKRFHKDLKQQCNKSTNFQERPKKKVYNLSDRLGFHEHKKQAMTNLYSENRKKKERVKTNVSDVSLDIAEIQARKTRANKFGVYCDEIEKKRNHKRNQTTQDEKDERFPVFPDKWTRSKDKDNSSFVQLFKDQIAEASSLEEQMIAGTKQKGENNLSETPQRIQRSTITVHEGKSLRKTFIIKQLPIIGLSQKIETMQIKTMRNAKKENECRLKTEIKNSIEKVEKREKNVEGNNARSQQLSKEGEGRKMLSIKKRKTGNEWKYESKTTDHKEVQESKEDIWREEESIKIEGWGYDEKDGEIEFSRHI